MDNPEALATLGIQETGRKLTKKKEKDIFLATIKIYNKHMLCLMPI
jgi:hypothetical protein